MRFNILFVQKFPQNFVENFFHLVHVFGTSDLRVQKFSAILYGTDTELPEKHT